MINLTATGTTDEAEEALSSEQLTEIKRKSISGVLSFFIRTALLQAIGLAAIFFLSTYLSAEDFGIYAIVTQIIGLLVFFSDIGFAAALVQKKTEPSLSEYRTAFTVQQLLSWLIVIVCALIASSGFLAQKTGPAGNWILLSLAISFPLASLKTISSIILERKLEFSKVVIPQIVEQLVFQGLLIIMVSRGMGVIAYAYAIVARSVMGLIAMWCIQRWSVGLAWDRAALKGLLDFGAKFQLNDFLARIKDQLYFLILGAFLPLREFGYISWAKSWSLYPYNLTVQNVMAITFPIFSRLQSNTLSLQKAIEKSLFFITLVIFPLLMGMIIFIYPLTQVIPQWSKWVPAVVSFIFFTFSIGWSAISTPLTNTLNATGKINSTLRLMVFWTILTWVLTPVLLYFFGFNGVALSAVLISFTSVLPIYLVKKTMQLDVWSQVWRQLGAASIMGVVGYLGISYWAQGVAQFLIGVIVVGSVYPLMLLLIGRKKVWAEFSSLRS